MDASRPVGAFPDGDNGVSNLARRTGATACCQVKVEVMLGEVLPVGTPRHFGHQLASRISESLPRPTVALGGVAQGCGNQASALASLCSTKSNAPRLSGALPGSMSTAVINWVSVSTTMAAWCPSKRLLLLLRPWRISGSCTDIIRSRLTPSLRLTPPSPWPSSSPPLRSTSCGSNCPNNSAASTISRPPLDAVCIQHVPRLPRQLQQPVRVRHNLRQQLPP